MFLIKLMPRKARKQREAKTEKTVSIKKIIQDPVNKDAVREFALISSSLILAPAILYSGRFIFNWSLEIWGVASVVVINILIAYYAYSAWVEDQKK